MGDRANIVLRQNGQPIYLYTHWGGYDLPETLRQGLERGRNRWNHPHYLGRIIFCTMVEGQEREETGFGIGVGPSDNSYDFLVVDADRGVVEIVDGDGLACLNGEWVKPKASFTFAEYVASAPRTWEGVTV